MFEYSCSDNRLVNWVIQQVDGDHESLFPKEKGWSLYLNLYYATSKGQPVFLVTLVNDEEFITFLTVDKLVEGSVIGQFKQSKIFKYVRKSLSLKDREAQLIFLGSEKVKRNIIRYLGNDLSECPVLILNTHSIEFRQGGFLNSRLEFRLSQLTFKADLIPEIIPPGFWHFDDGLAKKTIFQHLFHQLSKSWVRGETKIGLDQLISEAIPYWREYSKKNRKEILASVYDEFKSLNALIFQDILEIQSGRDGSNDKIGSIVIITLDPQIKKNQILWTKKQNRALEWLKNSRGQISVDQIKDS